MSKNQAPPRSIGISLGIIAFILVIAGMREATSIVVPFLLAVFGALIISPVVGQLERKGVPTAAAIAVAMLGMLLALAAFGFLAGNSVQEFTDKLPGYRQQLTERLEGIRGILGDGAEHKISDLLSALDPARAMSLAASVLNGISGALSNAFMILLMMIFMLFDLSSLPDKIRAAIPDSRPWLDYLANVTEGLKKYMVIKTAISLATGVAVGVVVALLGVDFAILWGVLAFVLNYVPNIGSILAAIPAVLLALIQFGPGKALAVIGAYLAINVVFGNVIEPRLTGQGVGLSTLIVFLSLIFWGWVLGPVGMLLSVPLTMVVKIALEAGPGTRWAAAMLDSAPLAPAKQQG